MYYHLMYLIPLAMAVFAIWFFYPSLTGRRETKISPGEYAWFILCIVGILIFGSGLFLTALFLESWYANPQELDIRFLPLVLMPWVVISGAGTAYGIWAIDRLRKRSSTPEAGDGNDENRSASSSEGRR
ncbi:MAG: hypothetical protein PHP59_09605 [Methanofollis sp.]|uniref:hypothetical protein n=1 Tax=Methanofollis sp. TaxID=2052835 RepID=UPI00261FECED|nr:hypothetical protein [Methanofollis sp.]MDD4255614.1 hypothetical protein [Methanofollis sp.]